MGATAGADGDRGGALGIAGVGRPLALPGPGDGAGGGTDGRIGATGDAATGGVVGAGLRGAGVGVGVEIGTCRGVSGRAKTSLLAATDGAGIGGVCDRAAGVDAGTGGALT